MERTPLVYDPLKDPKYRFEERWKRLVDSKGFTEEEAKEVVTNVITKEVTGTQIQFDYSAVEKRVLEHIVLCPCGKTGEFYSSLLDRVFCSEACYIQAKREWKPEQLPLLTGRMSLSEPNLQDPNPALERMVERLPMRPVHGNISTKK